MGKMTMSIAALLCVLVAVPVWAGPYQYITPAEVKQKIADRVPMQLIDIQVEEEYAGHHLVGALNTHAYPVKSEADRTKLNSAMTQLLSNPDPVVIICPRGGGGAKRAYDHLARQGVADGRLFILEQGQQGWPYPELLEKTM
jgi:thiosulfate/3-mercaptopyruvate sulfurtransferase